METLLAAVEASGTAAALRTGRWSYAAVNAAHILGIALLVGPIMTLDLRMLGLWRSVPLAPLAVVLRPVAASGLAVAVAAGLALFSVQAAHYGDLALFQAKLALIIAGAGGALALHRAAGPTLERAAPGRLRLHALLSISCWLGALVCGRLIAFVEG
ncbi:MAG: DUF2214 domain-containing protein [Marivibrio sp.]|uniref:DUF2214 domain-containing protein n=1 Tax=Marivibrio sp. TaxID=2039719 RepID=UPI0032EF4C6C